MAEDKGGRSPSHLKGHPIGHGIPRPRYRPGAHRNCQVGACYQHQARSAASPRRLLQIPAPLHPAGGKRVVLWALVALGMWAGFSSRQGPGPRISLSIGLSEIPVLVGIVFSAHLPLWRPCVADSLRPASSVGATP